LILVSNGMRMTTIEHLRASYSDLFEEFEWASVQEDMQWMVLFGDLCGEPDLINVKGGSLGVLGSTEYIPRNWEFVVMPYDC
jgi:hypothetical protein